MRIGEGGCEGTPEGGCVGGCQSVVRVCLYRGGRGWPDPFSYRGQFFVPGIKVLKKYYYIIIWTTTLIHFS